MNTASSHLDVTAWKQRLSDECNVAIFAQVYLDQQRRKQKAVPRRKRGEDWKQRERYLDECQESIDRILEAV